MDYRSYITSNFPEIFENQYRIYKDGDEEIIYYKSDDTVLYWNNLMHLDITKYIEEIFIF